MVQLQAARKGKKDRQNYLQQKDFYKSNEDAIVKIQATWKAKKAEKSYKAMSSLKNPPSVKMLQEFLHLLDDNDNDYSEEIELERLRLSVVRTIKENQTTESDLSDLDNKIALLVKNRITLEEVSHMTSKKMKAKYNAAEAENANSSFNNLKGQDKETKQKLENYGHLFHLLQTKPEYLAKMMWTMNNKSGGNLSKQLESYVMALYGYAQNTREEYLLLQLISVSTLILLRT